LRQSLKGCLSFGNGEVVFLAAGGTDAADVSAINRRIEIDVDIGQRRGFKPRAGAVVFLVSGPVPEKIFVHWIWFFGLGVLIAKAF